MFVHTHRGKMRDFARRLSLFRIIVFAVTAKLIYCVSHNDASDLLLFCSGFATVANAADDDVANCTNLIQMRMRMRMCNLHWTKSQRFTIVVLCHKCTQKQSGSMHFTRAIQYSYVVHTLYYIRLYPKSLPTKSNRENVIHTHISKMRQLCSERLAMLVSVRFSVYLSGVFPFIV